MNMICKEVTDCGNEGCDECDVCSYLNFLEWCGQVSGGMPSVIERDGNIEDHLDRTCPGWRAR